MTPFISVIVGLSLLMLHRLGRNPPSFSFGLSLLFFLSWIVNISLWANCDFTDLNKQIDEYGHIHGKLSFCTKWPLLPEAVNWEMGHQTSPLQTARFFFSILVVVCWLAVLICSGKAALDGIRKKNAERRASVEAAEAREALEERLDTPQYVVVDKAESGWKQETVNGHGDLGQTFTIPTPRNESFF
jgi:hypothetical protein